MNLPSKKPSTPPFWTQGDPMKGKIAANYRDWRRANPAPHEDGEGVTMYACPVLLIRIQDGALLDGIPHAAKLTREGNDLVGNLDVDECDEVQTFIDLRAQFPSMVTP